MSPQRHGAHRHCRLVATTRVAIDGDTAARHREIRLIFCSFRWRAYQARRRSRRRMDGPDTGGEKRARRCVLPLNARKISLGISPRPGLFQRLRVERRLFNAAREFMAGRGLRPIRGMVQVAGRGEFFFTPPRCYGVRRWWMMASSRRLPSACLSCRFLPSQPAPPLLPSPASCCFPLCQCCRRRHRA